MSFVLLSAVPWWSILVFTAVFSFVGIPLFRLLFEGEAYNVSFSGTYGELALAEYLMIVKLLVDKRGASPSWVLERWWHFGIVFLAIIVGLVLWSQPDGHDQIVDGFHNIVVAPFLLYLIVSTLPAIISAGREFIIFSLLCFLVWGFFVYVDIKTKRLKQKQWVKDHPTKPRLYP